ncbi:hypothetical protein Q8G40_28605, partial [Klebsiella pneumoniae]|uniref:hypothetical protein n=1 Tax=Klebsiella pneumoniae TaxID=573 RepID=UPI003013941C
MDNLAQDQNQAKMPANIWLRDKRKRIKKNIYSYQYANKQIDAKYIAKYNKFLHTYYVAMHI